MDDATAAADILKCLTRVFGQQMQSMNRLLVRNGHDKLWMHSVLGYLLHMVDGCHDNNILAMALAVLNIDDRLRSVNRGDADSYVTISKRIID